MVDFTGYNAAIQAKLDGVTGATPVKDILLLAKAVEATVGNATVSDVNAAGATNIGAVNGAGAVAVAAVEAAQGTAAAAIIGAGSDQIADVAAAGAAQITAVEAAGDAKIDEINSIGGGGGDVVGPASSVDGRVAVYVGTSGKQLGELATPLGTAAFVATGTGAGNVPVLDGGGKLPSATLPTLGTAAAADTGTGAGNIPVLDGGGKLPSSLLPAIAITDVFEVASQAAMLALTAQRGDIAIRTDLNKTFALATDSPSTLADWKELRTPTDVVLAVAGLTGTITASDLRTALSLVVGTDVQAYNAKLAAIAGLTAAADKLAYFTGASAAAVTDLTATGRAVIGAANAAAVRSAIGLIIGTDVPALSAAALLAVDQVWTGAQRSGTGTTLTSGTTITPTLADWEGNRAALTLAHNATLANPTDIASMVGYCGRIVGQQDGTGGRTLAYGSYWYPIGAATAPAAPTGANAKFRIDFEVVSATRIDFALNKVGV